MKETFFSVCTCQKRALMSLKRVANRPTIDLWNFWQAVRPRSRRASFAASSILETSKHPLHERTARPRALSDTPCMSYRSLGSSASHRTCKLALQRWSTFARAVLTSRFSSATSLTHRPTSFVLHFCLRRDFHVSHEKREIKRPRSRLNYLFSNMLILDIRVVLVFRYEYLSLWHIIYIEYVYTKWVT